MAILPVSGLANMAIAALANFLRFDEFADAIEKMGHVTKDIDVAAGGTITLVKGAGGNFIEGKRFKLTGAPAAAFTLKVPDGDRVFEIQNTSGKLCTLDTVGGSTLKPSIPDGDRVKVIQDGVELERDGTRGTQTIWVPASAMTETVSNGCSVFTIVETTAGRPDQHVRYFDPAADEHAQFGVAFPKSWDKGEVTYRARWTHQGGQTAGLDGVAWALQAVALSNDEAFATVYGTPVVVTGDEASTDRHFVSAESAAVTVANTPIDGDITIFRVFRDVSDAADDLDIDAGLVGIDIFYRTDEPTDD